MYKYKIGDKFRSKDSLRIYSIFMYAGHSLKDNHYVMREDANSSIFSHLNFQISQLDLEQEFERLLEETKKTEEIKVPEIVVVPKCVIVKNIVAHKEFFYCRTHDQESHNLYRCPKG